MGFRWNSVAALGFPEPELLYAISCCTVQVSPLRSSLGRNPSGVLKPRLSGTLWQFIPLRFGSSSSCSLSILGHVRTLWMWNGSYCISWGSSFSPWQNFDRAGVGILVKIFIGGLYKQGATAISVVNQYVCVFLVYWFFQNISQDHVALRVILGVYWFILLDYLHLKQ